MIGMVIAMVIAMVTAVTIISATPFTCPSAGQ